MPPFAPELWDTLLFYRVHTVSLRDLGPPGLEPQEEEPSAGLDAQRRCRKFSVGE